MGQNQKGLKASVDGLEPWKVRKITVDYSVEEWLMKSWVGVVHGLEGVETYIARIFCYLRLQFSASAP